MKRFLLYALALIAGYTSVATIQACWQGHYDKATFFLLLALVSGNTFANEFIRVMESRTPPSVPAGSSCKCTAHGDVHE